MRPVWLAGWVCQALEIIPRQLAENAGFDSTDILNLLRRKHTHEKVGPGRPIMHTHTALLHPNRAVAD